MLYNILLVDDNPAKLDLIRVEWKKYGVSMTNIYTAKEAVKALKGKEYHLAEIVVDHVNESLLPSIKAIRDVTDMPIIILTSKYDSIEMIASIRCGADEYLLIPDTLEELVLIGFAHIRRYCAFDCGRHKKNIISFWDIRVDR